VPNHLVDNLQNTILKNVLTQYASIAIIDTAHLRDMRMTRVIDLTASGMPVPVNERCQKLSLRTLN
jgi:hypothetical protein